MNWVGDLIQKNIEKNDTILDLGCGIMQSTLDHIKTYPKTRLKCKSITGVDIYKPYLNYLNSYYPEIKTIEWDLRKTPLPFKDKSYDVILLIDVLEHIDDFIKIYYLMKEVERIARKKIFVLTPTYFFRNENAINYYKMGANIFELHELLITKSYLKNWGFKILLEKPKHIFAIKKTNLNIIHFFDVAGVAGIMSKYQKRLGHNVKVFINKEWDIYNFKDVYNYHLLLHSPKILNNKYFKKLGILRILIKYLMMNILIIINNPDIIHFHVYEFYPLFFPFRKKLIEFHGTRLRKKYADGSINKLRKTPYWIFKLYRLFKIPYYVSTEDLLNDIPNSSKDNLINNPVDIELFNKNIVKIKLLEETKYKVGLYCINHYEDFEKRIYDINQKIVNFIVICHNRLIKDDIILYRDFPKFLSFYDYFIDRNNIKSLSKTALEALSMGLKVIRYDNKIIKGLPKENNPFNVAKKTIEIYYEIIGGVK